MNWSVTEYEAELRRKGKRITGHNEELEKSLEALFPPVKPTEFIGSPCVVVDRDGIVILWYLPGIFSRKRRVGDTKFKLYQLLKGQQAVVWESTELLETSLKVVSNSSSWRINRKHYQAAPAWRYKSGSVNFALAWYQQGMQVKRNYIY